MSSISAIGTPAQPSGVRWPGGGTVSGPFPATFDALAYPAGEVCPFPLTSTPVRSDVRSYRYTTRDGFLAAEFFQGPLDVVIRNERTGRSASYDLGGSALDLYGRGGATTIYGAGPYGVALHPGDAGGPAYLIPSGISELVISADGTKRLAYASKVRDVCRELG